MEWYEQERFWEYYLPILIESATPTHVREQVDQIVKLLAVPDGARILDLGCGIGRHCLELARRGYRVTGVDRTARVP
ncbi:MAG: hypothetical protein KatS3mg115_2153 [Candidatus Poribacteria bacterium]|nr:MAG: hypothetical protein KatS3mg115_2153 [Candidatus Poribacteria bacterium]